MKNKKKAIIKLKNVGKEYILHHEKPTFIENLVKKNYQKKFTALKDVSLSIYGGEKIGVIGLNGAGKTTLLKIIAEIAAPDSGTVKTSGKIASLISLEAGFHSELTGEENIFLNGMVIGMSRQEIRRKYKRIVEFANIGEFINMPLYTYSSGMQLRLGFAIAIHSEFDTLVLDESLAVGDKVFQHKIFSTILSLSKKGKTLVFASQDLETIKKYYDRVIWMHKGSIKMDGSSKKVTKAYKDWTDEFYRRTKKQQSV